MAEPKRIIIGISGASGAIYGIRLLELLQPTDIEVHLIISKAASMTIAQETDWSLADIQAMADEVHSLQNVGASIASGSFHTMGMVIAPCSTRTLSEMASGVTTTLLTRAADVVLKEQRKLVCMLRETPLHAGHLRSALQLAEMGAVISPPVPAFYSKPASLEEMIDHTLGRVLDQFDIDVGIVTRWKGLQVA